ncbi:MAG: glycosyltransferase [Pseudomonadota bacterium]
MLLLLYILALAALALHAPEALWQPEAQTFIFIIGAVGIWRYGWGIVHFVRSLIYRHRVFPKWRRAADSWLDWVQRPASDPDLKPEEVSSAGPKIAIVGADQPVDPVVAETPSYLPAVYVVITSYRIAADTTIAAFRAAIQEAIDYGGEVTIVASVVEMADQRLIKSLFYRLSPPERVRIGFVRISGQGKRIALATALRAVSRMRPEPHASVVVMDGDTLIEPGCFRRCVPFFAIMPQIAGLTTDEDAIVERRPLMAVWHRLRFAQRQLLMCSMGLSQRLLTMTGRFSIYRAGIATNPSFIERIENDALEHWRLGHLPFLTGEDKSTWFWLVENGHRMLYVPDVRVYTIEHPPAPDFITATSSLMLRWFGNMIRSSGRVIAMGPRRAGFFLWWCLIDQRLSMWTPLVGPIAAISLSLIVTPVFLYAYFLWIATTRLIQTLMLLTVRDTVSGLYPFLIFFNQVYGALIKTYVLFHLDRQRWTRQNIVLANGVSGHTAIFRQAVSTYMHGLALLALATAIFFATGLLAMPPTDSLLALFSLS